MSFSSRPVLMAIVESRADTVAGAIEGGVDLIQVRARDWPGKKLVRLTRQVIAAAGGGERVIINARPDIAVLLGARGVHLPEAGLDPCLVRRSFPGLVIGVSRHDRAGLKRAVDEGADYALLGPVFETPGKEERALGLVRFQEAVNGLRIPVIAVGGITPRNAREVVQSGASGVAAIRPFAIPAGVLALAAAFREALDARDR